MHYIKICDQEATWVGRPNQTMSGEIGAVRMTATASYMTGGEAEWMAQQAMCTPTQHGC